MRVKFSLSDKRNMYGRINGRYSFIDKQYENMLVQPGETWECEIVGNTKSVNFLRPIEKLEDNNCDCEYIYRDSKKYKLVEVLDELP